MEPEDGVETEEQPLEFNHILGAGFARPDLGGQPLDPAGLMDDLAVAPAHRSHGVRSPHEARHDRIQGVFLCLFMGQQLLVQPSAQRPDLFEAGRVAGQSLGRDPHQLHDGADLPYVLPAAVPRLRPLPP